MDNLEIKNINLGLLRVDKFALDMDDLIGVEVKAAGVFPDDMEIITYYNDDNAIVVGHRCEVQLTDEQLTLLDEISKRAYRSLNR
ncbi:hypothetical protein GCM10009347_01780 [Shewanella algicola]|uniref:Uncharacterized protein n=1 Tax=Shewanella algicola TaxID=640633 RepID=A0A9X2C9H2_9GAMM|nr:hypothetical protein [Shewanella algicola]MCL1103720.1 hypothetical protein [Shewanella algicola]GGP37453.1 hypothetical protein GCM10009347_01780 [Shewanella algicola]